MSSDWEIVCRAIADDLRNNVPRLVEVEEANVHLLSPWSPEELTADGKAHLAVWPVGDAETAEPLVTGSHTLNQVYAILYWESSGTEGVRLVSDEAGAAALLELHNEIRDGRIYREAFQNIGGSDRAWYVSTSFPEQVSRVRGFEIRLAVKRFVDFVTA